MIMSLWNEKGAVLPPPAKKKNTPEIDLRLGLKK